MALIKNAKPKGDIKDSGYFRAIGDETISEIMQKIQSTVISNGSELEKYIEKFCPYNIYKTQWTNVSPLTNKIVKTKYQIPNTTPTLDTVFEKLKKGENCFFPKIRISKKELLKYDVDLKSKKNIELDGVWIIDNKIYISEIKDGSDFDTKKSDGEIEMFKKLESVFKKYDTRYFIVLWNLDDINNNSVKSLEAFKYVITGYDFSKLVGIDFGRINKERQKDQIHNRTYIYQQLKPWILEYEANN